MSVYVAERAGGSKSLFYAGNRFRRQVLLALTRQGS